MCAVKEARSWTADEALAAKLIDVIAENIMLPSGHRHARWGLLECLATDMPVLGLVQYAGHPGLYLLPHGNAERSVGWSPLGRSLFSYWRKVRSVSR